MSANSVAPAAPSGLGQCTLSSTGQSIVNDINTLNKASSTLQQLVTEWTGDSLDAVTIYDNVMFVDKDVNTIYQDLISSGGSATECDITTVISLLDDAASTLISALQSLGGLEGALNTVHKASFVAGEIQTLSDDTMQLIGLLYSWLPCQYVGKTFDILDDIAAAFAAVLQDFGQTLTSTPTQPVTCGASSTSPPSICHKKQSPVSL
ncbi:hypothetical protein TRVA0_020S00694 [Trichomonascus vanleenenianus]|uniref:uncharacterized protein n=1 Tax=Trichomonascus vanleenenianus TaxID=2268995 RepID=UPI003ECA40F4